MSSGQAVLVSRTEEIVAEEVQHARPRDFESFYRQSSDGVYRSLAVMLGDSDLAQDAAAEALARTFQHWPKVSGYDSPAGWAYRVGMNWATSRRRRNRLSDDLLGPTRATDDPADAADLRLDLIEALGQLEPAQREVLVLRYLLDLRQDEVARVLGVPTGTVKSRLGRGLERLREVVDG